jgi:hypothetical protein
VCTESSSQLLELPTTSSGACHQPLQRDDEQVPHSTGEKAVPNEFAQPCQVAQNHIAESFFMPVWSVLQIGTAGASQVAAHRYQRHLGHALKAQNVGSF